ncbi:NAD(P)H-dependent glycerol-3-phosphate dehydrogenase [Sulfuricurvum sp.]|uniref:NAD(P)H-dependent glycerol-3-phosphate dehydrogenase n=1 Tax=Sulfuricurvum sp. TaxID=2025608 RepID=UPI002601CF71|nr:NAD(P)H-dependent glycerol-3-phosphate dehydrogenase [Sulfuricurvum sp.]MDD2266364.1 NAD(P)H-dependent glycerol-3-phosphate dehydrogenase [Sulfuricurvum sp.]MDD2785101.1 NAD(P)H-dependent glycerol-3-phosphate dehydrogenase [Sulfuricurvum sp.]HZF69242.1 NAD(P)H-dependent glycerol-3-phosphate dehydrogenase [Sulfuricurvum sp.]
MKKVGIIGAGKWGEALSFAMSEKNEVIITSRTPRNWPNFRPLEEVLKCEYLIITVPAQQIGKWLEENFVFSGQKILVAAKGIEASSGRFLNEIYMQYIPSENLCFLSGPSFAAEVIRSLPTALVINSTSLSTAREFAALFPKFIRTYVSEDVIGAEITGAYKNVIAIAAGICEGLGLGHNAAASLIARGLVEMERFGRAYGASQESFLGLSGAGDLFLTASSSMSRNYRVGLGLAQGKNKEQVCMEIGEVSEGIGTAYALHEIAEARGVYLPIAAEVYAILEGKSPRQSLKDLIER